ncbi:hemolysin family protein [Bacteriovoracaceae bacterium]|nr:hemolysin family protein [Bacteriovoracaceae bacterium]|tara:strand:+ start:8850 stop:10235 length:1386 start_codon:yes stop_codon:yes gene_type:complete
MPADIPVSTLEIVSLITCFVLSGFFSGSEAVLMSLGVDRAQQLIEEGGSKSKAMLFMVEQPNELLATILVGNNVVNILAASLTTTITTRIVQSDAIGISTGITTLIILFFGEILPKTFARTHAEKLSVFIIYVLRLKYYILYPIIKGMVVMIRAILGGSAELSGRLVTKNDIEYMINKAEQDKTMDSKQLDLLNSILEFPTIKVKDIMIPRLEVKYIQEKWSFHEIIKFVEEDGYSRYPVCSGELENTVGFMHVKDLAFVRGAEKGSFDINPILKEPFFVYEHMKIQAVFDHMNRKKVHLALVKDENGLVVGIVTLEDIVEEIFGEIQDEHDEDEIVTSKEAIHAELEEGIFIEGTLSLRDLYNEFDIKIPLNDNYSTVAGFILDMLGNTFPEQGQMIVWEGFSFELTTVEDYEIKGVKVKDLDGEKHLYSKSGVNDKNENSEKKERKIDTSLTADFNSTK